MVTLGDYPLLRAVPWASLLGEAKEKAITQISASCQDGSKSLKLLQLLEKT